VRTLDRPNEERTKTLLSYFVVFGFVQFAESLMAGFLERRIRMSLIPDNMAIG
jgi:hypothetical protein